MRENGLVAGARLLQTLPRGPDDGSPARPAGRWGEIAEEGKILVFALAPHCNSMMLMIIISLLMPHRSLTLKEYFLSK